MAANIINIESILFLVLKFYELLWAYCKVQARALAAYSSGDFLYKSAISGMSGSFGFGSVRREQILRRTLLMVNAGDQFVFRISRHIMPAELIFG